MGANDILKVFDRHPDKEFTSREISKYVNIAERSVRRVLKDLLKDVSENLKVRQLTEEEKVKKYGRNINNKRIFIYWISK